MPIIRTEMLIHAAVDRCFDLARSIDIHMASTARTKERAVGGVTSGLIEHGESVTWEAVHFGIRQRLSVKISEYDRPHFFVDEMIDGAFQRFWHEHRFIARGSSTLMIDTFDYTSPLGWLGRAADRLFLERYMRKFLVERNQYIKEAAERG
ncbi:cell division protein [Paenibacillaceae bacterium]|nr:cell division protein [Paenibacillaceae bacterium]